MKRRIGWQLWWFILPLYLLGAVGAIAAIAGGQGETKERVITIESRQFKYSPNVITVNKGDRVRLRFISRDVQHGLYIDGYGLEVNAIRGEEAEILFVADKMGRFSFRCSVTCGDFHPYKIGYLRVLPNTRLYAGMLATLAIGLIFALSTLGMGRRKQRGNPAAPSRLLGIIPLEWRLELTKPKIIRRAFKSRWLPFLLIVINLFIFTLIMLAGLVGARAGNYNFGVMVVWVLWWVLLMVIIVPFFGRLWCGVCPLPVLGEWLQRFRLIGVTAKLKGLNRRWPRRLSNMWLMNFVFLAATYFAAFFTVRPLANLYLFLLIIAAAVLVFLVYQRRTFCRYLCVVSGFQGLYANFSLSEIRVKDHEICRKHRPKTCYVGNDRGYGCPWLCLPYNMERNTYCGMCLECFKTCPYDNIAWNIRPPGVDLLVRAGRGLDEAWKAFIMLGAAVAFYTVMQGPWGLLKDWARAKTLPGYFAYLGSYTVFTLVLIPLLFLAFAYLSKRWSGDSQRPLKEVFVNFSYALVPLGLAIWVAFSLGIILPNGSYLLRIVSDPFAWGWNIFGTASFKWTPLFTGTMPYLQILILMMGLVFSLEYGHKIAQQTYLDEKARIRGWIPMFVLLIATTLFLTWLFVG